MDTGTNMTAIHDIIAYHDNTAQINHDSSLPIEWGAFRCFRAFSIDVYPVDAIQMDVFKKL